MHYDSLLGPVHLINRASVLLSLSAAMGMVFILDGFPFFYGHIWRHFDLVKAFGYIERVVKSEKKSGLTYVTSYESNNYNELPSYISTIGYMALYCSITDPKYLCKDSD